MSYTRAQLMTNTREMMDAASSQRWGDPFVRTALGIAGASEWQGILNANPYYRFAQRSVSTDAAGQFAYTALNSGTGDSAQTWNRILAITDGNIIYRQTEFLDAPLATASGFASLHERSWYDAGANVQILPVSSGLSLTVSVNYTPTRIDQLTADSVTVDFPDGSESIIWLEAAAYLLSKAGAENDAAQTMRAMADQERQGMYQSLRRAARPGFLRYPDSSSEWGG